MAIELSEKKSLELKIGKEQIVVYFRFPRTREFVRYLAMNLASSEKEGLERMIEAGIELGQACILGIREGDIILGEGTRREVLITDPVKPGYKENWKEIIKERMPVLLLMLGNYLAKELRADLEVREKN